MLFDGLCGCCTNPQRVLACAAWAPCKPLLSSRTLLHPGPADDLQAQDWLAAAASLARADSQPTYPNFPVEPPVPGGAAVPSLGSSPARPPSLPMPLAPGLLPPPLGLQQLHEHHWLAMMGTLQQAHHAQHAQQQRSAGGKGEGGGGGAGSGAGPSGKPPLGGDAPLSAVHRRLQQLAEEAGAAAAAAAGGAGPSSSKGKAAAGGADLDTAQELDGFGRYRQGSLHSLQASKRRWAGPGAGHQPAHPAGSLLVLCHSVDHSNRVGSPLVSTCPFGGLSSRDVPLLRLISSLVTPLAPDLQVDGFGQGLTPTTSARADPLLEGEDLPFELCLPAVGLTALLWPLCSFVTFNEHCALFCSCVVQQPLLRSLHCPQMWRVMWRAQTCSSAPLSRRRRRRPATRQQQRSGRRRPTSPHSRVGRCTFASCITQFIQRLPRPACPAAPLTPDLSCTGFHGTTV